MLCQKHGSKRPRTQPTFKFVVSNHFLTRSLTSHRCVVYSTSQTPPTVHNMYIWLPRCRLTRQFTRPISLLQLSMLSCRSTALRLDRSWEHAELGTIAVQWVVNVVIILLMSSVGTDLLKNVRSSWWR
mmetsp:Transcript_28429/g.45769  ORF Transcript_28429/g.45769 Transcript_28429/m.45769 type:complete len:128 (+) Transcript_28429:6344-6727(+)